MFARAAFIALLLACGVKNNPRPPTPAPPRQETLPGIVVAPRRAPASAPAEMHPQPPEVPQTIHPQ